VSFLSLTTRDREEMLAAIGVDSIDELFRDIPPGVRFDRELALEPALSEQEIVTHLEELAARNVFTTWRTCGFSVSARTTRERPVTCFAT